MRHDNGSKIDIILRRASLIIGAAFFISGLGEAWRAGAEILSGPPYSIVVSGFTGGGGEVNPQGSGRSLISAVGLTGIAKMEGGDFTIGTGIIGGVAVSGSNLDNAHVFPNPYIPSQGHAGVTFAQLTNQATIRVYTLAGELVQELSKTDGTTDRLAWFPVRNKQGEELASGVYLFVIKAADGQVKTGKMMVIK